MSKRTAKAKVGKRVFEFFGKDVFELHEDRRTLVINGVACRIKIDDDGFIQVQGPAKVWVQMREWEEAHNRLQSVSNAVGVDVNTLDPDALDQVLAENHANIVQLVPDGSVLDVSPEEYQSRIIEMDQLVEEFGNNVHEKAAIKRSGLIRKHMMAAKIEERIFRQVFARALPYLK